MFQQKKEYNIMNNITTLKTLASLLDNSNFFHTAQEVYEIIDNASENQNKKCVWCDQTFNIINIDVAPCEPFDKWICEDCIKSMEKYIEKLKKIN